LVRQQVAYCNEDRPHMALQGVRRSRALPNRRVI
jgi:hypothetical protein